MKVAVLGSSGAIGSRLVSALRDTAEVRRCVRQPDGTGFYTGSEKGVGLVSSWADVAVDAAPAWADKKVVSRLLDSIPVVSLGHLPVSGRRCHVRCAGALPGVLTAVPLLLGDHASSARTHVLISAPLTRSAARDLIEGARRDGDAPPSRSLEMPGAGLVVDAVPFWDSDTALVAGRVGGEAQWWSAWAGTRFRDALTRAVGMDVEEGASLLSAASGRGVLPGWEVVAHTEGDREWVSVWVPSVVELCVSMAVTCARLVAHGRAHPGPLPQQVTGLELLLGEGADLGEVIVGAGGTVSRSGDEEGLL